MSMITGDNEVVSKGQEVFFMALDEIVSGHIKDTYDDSGYNESWVKVKITSFNGSSANTCLEKPVSDLFVHKKNMIQNRMDSLILTAADLREEIKKIEEKVKHLKEQLTELSE